MSPLDTLSEYLRNDVALEAASRVAGPLVEFLLQEGVSYPRFADALKVVFLEAAKTVLAADNAKVNDSSISTLSGVHRKDVRAWRSAGHPPSRSKSLSSAMEVYARWASDPAYCNARGKPRTLDRAGETESFEELAYSVSKDVHPHALLQELIRLGVVRRIETSGKDQKLALCADAFVPKEGGAEMLQLFSDNIGDHIAAAVNNLTGRGPMLEQAVYADGLRPDSIKALSALARQIWMKGFREFARQATKLHRRDQGHPEATQRVRFGMYSYRGPATRP